MPTQPTTKYVWYKSSPIMIRVIGAISCIALSFLILIIYFNPFAQEEKWIWVGWLPLLNSVLNFASAVCVCCGVYYIKKINISVHRRYMTAAFVFSTLFLVSYIVYHSLHGDTKFLGQGLIRAIYFFVLISHIITSILALPIILVTFFFALSQKITLHKNIVKMTVPLWLYVSVTGILVYALLRIYG